MGEMMNGDRRQYVITRLPQYLIIHIKRFSKNTQQYVEKNPTIVNFPVRNLDLAAYTELSDADNEKNVQTKFNLMSSTQHDGHPDSGTYRTYVHFKANDQWYDIPLPLHAPRNAPLSFAQEPQSLAPS